jgi:hypothetical protein
MRNDSALAMKLSRKALITGIVCVAIGGGVSLYQITRPNLPSYGNTNYARGVQTGATKRQLVKLLGDPVGESEGWTRFQGSPPEGRDIRAKFDSKGQIEAIDCGDGQIKYFSTK